jgi:ppGpp synthetase/RelA/SpoT-type nucleotidyltranferase
VAALTLEEYMLSEATKLGFPADLNEIEKPYKFSIDAARTNLQSGNLIQGLLTHLETIRQSYSGGRPDLLFYPDQKIDFQILSKPFSSVVSKIYRINYLNNRKFPEPPRRGFLNSTNFYENLNDLLRTRIVCKYLDGPRFIADAISTFCESEKLRFRCYPMASELGYHAWHCYVAVPIQAIIVNELKDIEIELEIQLTTQLAEVIGSLTHGLYEGQRESLRAQQTDEWRWDPQSKQFRSAYLGHTLHLLEGVIQNFKDDVLNDKDGAKPRPVDEVTQNGH